MCSPELLGAGSAGAGIVGGVIGVAGAFEAAKTARTVADARARIQELQADNVREASAIRIERTQEKAKVAIGRAKVAFAAGNIDGSVGSARAITLQISAQATSDVSIIQRSAELQSAAIATSADFTRFEGQLQAQALRLRGIGGIISTAAGGAGAASELDFGQVRSDLRSLPGRFALQ